MDDDLELVVPVTTGQDSGTLRSEQEEEVEIGEILTDLGLGSLFSSSSNSQQPNCRPDEIIESSNNNVWYKLVSDTANKKYQASWGTLNSRVSVGLKAGSFWGKFQQKITEEMNKSGKSK